GQGFGRSGEHERTSGIVAHLCRKREPAAKDVEHQISDGRAIARAGEAMRLAPVGQSLCRGPVMDENLVQHFDGSFHSSTRPHRLEPHLQKCRRSNTRFATGTRKPTGAPQADHTSSQINSAVSHPRSPASPTSLGSCRSAVAWVVWAFSRDANPMYMALANRGLRDANELGFCLQ